MPHPVKLFAFGVPPTTTWIADIICEVSLAPDVHAHVVLLGGSHPGWHLEAESAAAEIVVFVVAVDAVEVLLEEGADGGWALIGNVGGRGVTLDLGEDSFMGLCNC